MEDNRMKKLHINEMPVNLVNILDPDDTLMKKFQTTLHAHLLHIDKRLSEDILDLEASIKSAEKELESEETQLYNAQQEIERQHKTIEQYRDALTKITTLREKKNESITNVREDHKVSRSKLEEEQKKKGQLSRKLQNLLGLQERYNKWEKDTSDYVAISKRISLHDATAQKELIERKQRSDYILCWLEEEVWKIETDIAYLDEQLQLKDREKADTSRMIADANADLDALHKEHKELCDTWTSIVADIQKRDNVYDQLNSERERVRKLYDTLLLEVEKIRKETNKEMETNEHLMSLSTRVESNVQVVTRLIATENEKIANLESQLMTFIKLGEQAQNDYKNVCGKYQDCSYREEQASKELENVVGRKNKLEEAIFAKLEDKVIRDKAARYIYELLQNSKEAVVEYEFTLVRLDNSYGNSLLELEKLANAVASQETELEEMAQKNVEKEKQMDELRKQITKYEVTIERKQRKVLGVHKLIEQILPNIGGEELSPQDLKIISLEKNIKEIQQNTQKSQQFWMRQQSFMVSLSQQRDSQLRELSLLNKEIMIMEQKNLKLEYALEMLAKEQSIASKTLCSLEQKLSQINAVLVAQKDLKEELEDKTSIMKSECIQSFQQLETTVVQLQGELKDLADEKILLREELYAAQQESLSWEKRVQLTKETIKKLKEDRSAGSIASMKSEIHKMEMRLSHLKRVQEKLIHDMEFCVARRDIIFDKMIDKQRKNPKEQHNHKVLLRKRLSDQRANIKQLAKSTRQIENTIMQLQTQLKDVEDALIKCQATLKSFDDNGPDLQQEIERLEMAKCHNLQSLVFKQRKAKLFRDIKSGRYKMIFKNEITIEENFETEQIYRHHLKNVMEKTDQDFPMLKTGICKILLTLEVV